MAGSLNKVQLVGNVGQDPEIRAMNSGDKIANLSIATSETWKDKSTGEKKEKTEWHRVVVFGDGLVSVIERFVSKGSKLYVEGALQTRKWQDKDGADRYSTEIVLKPFNGNMILLGGKGSEDGAGSSSGGSTRSSGSSGGSSGASQSRHTPTTPDDDEIPF